MAILCVESIKRNEGDKTKREGYAPRLPDLEADLGGRKGPPCQAGRQADFISTPVMHRSPYKTYLPCGHCMPILLVAQLTLKHARTHWATS